jgi:hypothetical protein
MAKVLPERQADLRMRFHSTAGKPRFRDLVARNVLHPLRHLQPVNCYQYKRLILKDIFAAVVVAEPEETKPPPSPLREDDSIPNGVFKEEEVEPQEQEADSALDMTSASPDEMNRQLSADVIEELKQGRPPLQTVDVKLSHSKHYGTTEIIF